MLTQIRRLECSASGLADGRRRDESRDPVGQNGLFARRGQGFSIEDRLNEIFDDWIVYVAVGGKRFCAGAIESGDLHCGAVQRRQIELAFGADDAELIAHDARGPADIDYAVEAATVFDQDSRRVLDA